MLAHRTQMGPEAFFVKMGDALFSELFGAEDFIRLRSRVDAPDRETDLFAGLR